MCSIESQNISSDAYENLGTEQKGEYIETGNTYTRHVVTITKTIDPSTFNVDGSTRSYKFVEQTKTTGAFDKNSDGKYHPLIFYSNDLKTMRADVVRVIDDSSFVVDEKIDLNKYEDDELLLYGQKPDDFYRLNKDAIFTLASAALQEVDRQLQAEKTKTTALETKTTALETKLQTETAALETKLQTETAALETKLQEAEAKIATLQAEKEAIRSDLSSLVLRVTALES